MTVRAGRGHTWVWIASGILAAGAVALSWGLDGLFVPHPAAQRDPEPVPEARLLAEQWKPLPSVPLHGHLPRSRWDAAPAFDVTSSTVEVGHILDMPPGVDDIPALDAPPFVPGAAATWLRPEDEVIGIARDGVARCYPLSILRWHNVVNDIIDGRSVAVVFDPLSGAAVALSRAVDGQALELGVSGKAYNGCALLYDRQHGNLWHPLRGEALAGPLAGRGRLEHIAVERTTWASWRARHRRTEVLSRNTGFARPYELDPYADAPLGPEGAPVDYWADPDLLLAPPAQTLDLRGLAPKTLVLGVVDGGLAVAYAPPGGDEPASFSGEFAGAPIIVRHDPRTASREFVAGRPDGARPTQLTCFWIAWLAAYPNTGLVRIE